MTNKSLNGLNVLVTRPQHQAGNLLQSLRAQGAEPIPFPLLSIVPIAEKDGGFHLLKQHILDLDLFQKVIFVSPNAVHIGYDWIDQYWPQLPTGIDWFAIGKQSSTTLNNYGIDAYHSPLGYDSEALLSCEMLHDIADEKILIMRGEGGREKLAIELRARGAEVSYAELYRRERPEYSEEEIANALYTQSLDAILISSGAGLHNLLQIANGQGKKFSTDSLLHCHLVVPSERIKQDAELAGFTKIITAAGPDDQSMINALLQ